MNDADGKRYGAALANALRHFPMHTTQKAIDISALIFCAVQMETPRMMISKQLAAQRRAGRSPRGPAEVFRFHQPQQQQPAGPATASMNAVPVEPPMAEGPPDLGTIGGEIPTGDAA